MLEEDGVVFISDVPDNPETFVPISRDELNKITMLGFDKAESEKYDQYYEYVSCFYGRFNKTSYSTC